MNKIVWTPFLAPFSRYPRKMVQDKGDSNFRGCSNKLKRSYFTPKKNENVIKMTDCTKMNITKCSWNFLNALNEQNWSGPVFHKPPSKKTGTRKRDTGDSVLVFWPSFRPHFPGTFFVIRPVSISDMFWFWNVWGFVLQTSKNFDILTKTW